MGWREILPFVAAQVGAQPNVSHAYHNPIVAGTLLTPLAFSPGASICFGGPDTCHDPNAIRSGVATAPQPLWRDSMSALGPGAQQCCPSCARGLKSCSASHAEEHLFVERILPLLGAHALEAPTFLEIGGQDGVLASNTIYLEKCLGWRGLLVEGAPHLFKRLVRERPSTVAIGSAICPEHRTVAFSKSRVQLDIARRKLMPGSRTRTRRQPSHRPLRSSNIVPCGPLGDYLALLNIKNITFFSLDVEGFELQVLRSIDWRRFEVSVMVAEELQHPSHRAKNDNVRQLLLEQANLRYLFSFCPPVVSNVCDAYFVNPRAADLGSFSQEGPVTKPATRECAYTTTDEPSPPSDEPTRIDSDTDRSEDTDQAKAEENGVAVVKGAEKPVIETKDKYGIYGPLQKATLQKITTLSEKVTKMEDQLVKLTATVEEQKKLIASQSVL